MIRIENLNKTIKKQHILKNVSLHVRKGTICGIVGNNGSGKTVLFKCILGFYFADSGNIWIADKQRRKKDGILTNAAAIIEHPAFLGKSTGIQNLRYLYELNHKKDLTHLNHVLDIVGLNGSSKKKVRNYSLGMRQRLAIAQVIMDDKEIMILDEPMNGLDKQGVAEMRELFRKQKEAGKTILLASHNREDIDILCDDVYEMDAGVLTKE